MKLRSLNYPCIFVDEYNTSQMCPKCKETYTDFVKNCHVRIKKCSQCEKYFHRDIMAAENIANKGLSQIYRNESIASYLGERPKKDKGESDSESQREDEIELDDSEEVIIPGPSNSQKKGKRKLDNSSSHEEANRSTRPRRYQPNSRADI